MSETILGRATIPSCLAIDLLTSEESQEINTSLLFLVFALTFSLSLSPVLRSWQKTQALEISVYS